MNTEYEIIFKWMEDRVVKHINHHHHLKRSSDFVVVVVVVVVVFM